MRELETKLLEGNVQVILVILVVWGSFKRRSCKNMMHQMASICQQQRDYKLHQGGRTWQPFIGGKNGRENFRQTRIYNVREKCVVFAHNRKFVKLTQ